MATILFISPSDFIYQPRIYKAAIFLTKEGYNVYIYTPITLKLTKEMIDEYSKRGIKFIYDSFLKNNLKGYYNWVYVSIVHKFVKFLKKYLNIEVLPEYYLNKYLLKTRKILKKNFSVLSINTVDLLPLAYKIKKIKKNIILIYDSQEYFKGQYSLLDSLEYNWVVRNEKKYISKCDLIITTTNVLKNRIIEDYKITKPVYRVRNAPSLNELRTDITISYPDKTINVIWSGVTINYKSERGIHIILEAFKYTNPAINLFLQGNINKVQRDLIEQFIKLNNLEDKIIIIRASTPNKYLESLVKFDIGVLGELGYDDNQKLTSSNKLFYYIAAGLAVVAPNLPGIEETIKVHNVGLIYEHGNPKDLADKLNSLSKDPANLYELKLNAYKTFKDELNWEKDYLQVYDYLVNNLI